MFYDKVSSVLCSLFCDRAKVVVLLSDLNDLAGLYIFTSSSNTHG
jgi:hypothetical protein